MLWTILVFVAVVALFFISGAVAGLLQTKAFGWIPEWFVMDSGAESGGFSKSALLIVNIASLFVFVIGIPIVEELYFRGFLLPRLSCLGVGAVF